MTAIEVTIAEIVVESDAEYEEAVAAATVVERAIGEVAERIQQSPHRWDGSVRRRLIDAIETSTLSLDELLGARGAERLADELFRELTKGWS